MKKASNSFDAETILFSHHLKKTSSALIVLAILNSKKNMAVSFRAILKRAKNLNYATLYGVLRRLEAKGVIYKVFDFKGTTHYALCPEDSIDIPSRVYFHFNCVVCKKIYCLNRPDSLSILLSRGFKAVSFTLCITGKCSLCNKPLHS
jgi:Fur family transcriptional regulator, ferric uptake regulator